MKAAFFEFSPLSFGRPFTDAIIRALLSLGCDVDVYEPGGGEPQALYPDSVRRFDAPYGRRWLTKTIASPRWRNYALFVAVPDLPIAMAGLLAARARRPLVNACAEIYTPGYEGAARGRWKDVSRWAMRRAALTVITDRVRIPLQREHAGLGPQHPFVEYPCCYPFAYDGISRQEARRALGISDDDFVLSFTGHFTAANSADWMVRLLQHGDPSLRAIVQTAGPPDPVVDALLTQLAASGRVIYRPKRLGWVESAAITVAADAGLALYRSEIAEMKLMGVSSTRVCTYLWLGMPVLATRQESFRFIEEYECGVLVDAEEELASAVARLRSERDAMARNAPRCVAEHIRPLERLSALTESFRTLLRAT